MKVNRYKMWPFLPYIYIYIHSISFFETSVPRQSLKMKTMLTAWCKVILLKRIGMLNTWRG